jgi:hypothetical protein
VERVRVVWRPRLRFLRNRSRAQAARGWAAMVETSSPSRWGCCRSSGRRQWSEGRPNSVWGRALPKRGPSRHHTPLRIVGDGRGARKLATQSSQLMGGRRFAQNLAVLPTTPFEPPAQVRNAQGCWMDLKSPPRLSEIVIEHRVFQCNFSCAVGRVTSARHLQGVNNENQVTMAGRRSANPLTRFCRRLGLRRCLNHLPERSLCLQGCFRLRKTIRWCESVWKHSRPSPQKCIAPDRSLAHGRSGQ